MTRPWERPAFLRESHIPFGVITNASLDQIDKYRAVVLPNVIEMTGEQAAVFREFVGNGGILYASGASSMSAPGDGAERLLLGDVLGVRYVGRTGGRTTYLSTRRQGLTAAIWPQENIGFSGPMVKVQAEPQQKCWPPSPCHLSIRTRVIPSIPASPKSGAILLLLNRARIRAL